MPIYEYQCADCGKTFEIFQKISDGPLTTCKECKGKLNKLISNCAFHLKGSGWYATDYKKSTDSTDGKGSGRKSEKTETKTETAPEGKAETKTDTNTATEKKVKKEKKNSETTGG